MEPKFTIGMCARNCEDILGSAIESVITQDYPHELMELIIVDDGSEDNTFSVIQSYARKTDIPVKVFTQQWRGLGFTRNFVIQNASGKYIIWVDSDEILEKSYVRKQVGFLDLHPSVGISVGILLMPADNLVTRLDLVPFLIDRTKYMTHGSELKPPGTGAAAYRVEALQKAGGFDVTIRGAGEDVEVGYRIKELGWSVGAANAKFWEKRGGIGTLRELWNRYFWYGYGNHKVHWKHSKAIGFPTMTPLAGIVSGLLYGIEGYKLTRERKLVFLLPATFALKYSAWCVGFTKSHIEKTRERNSSRN